MTDIFDRLKTVLADRYTIERELGAGGMATAESDSRKLPVQHHLIFHHERPIHQHVAIRSENCAGSAKVARSITRLRRTR